MSSPKFVYACRRCRQHLFTSSELLDHDPTKNTKGHKKFKYQKSFHADEQKDECTSLFLNPDIAKWVAAESIETAAARATAVEDCKRKLDEEEKWGPGGATAAEEAARKEGDRKAASAAGKKEAHDSEGDDDYDDDGGDDDEDDDSGSDGEVTLSDDDDDDGHSNSPGPGKARKAGAKLAEVAGSIVDPDTIYCPNPKCRTKIGAQSWMGSQCSCGAWVTPSFKVHNKAVDEIPAALLASS